MTYDSFLMIKFISMFCNTIMLFIIFNYRNNIAKRIEEYSYTTDTKSVDDAVDALEMVDVGKDTMFQNVVGFRKKSADLFGSTFISGKQDFGNAISKGLIYGSVFSILSSFYLININNYDLKIANYTKTK